MVHSFDILTSYLNHLSPLQGYFYDLFLQGWGAMALLAPHGSTVTRLGDPAHEIVLKLG